ncbi:hypothetical protein [Arthrobacter sp. AQ5-05]|nr:hypothetical protein [Arthrobacter sp. AQ5-05]
MNHEPVVLELVSPLMPVESAMIEERRTELQRLGNPGTGPGTSGR